MGLPKAIRSRGVPVRVVGGALRDAHGLRRGAQPGALEGRQRDAHPAVDLADDVLRRQPDVLEDRRAGRGAPDAELVLVAADREARRLGLHDEGRHPRVLAVGHREDDVEVGDPRVRDPVLRAVEDPLVAIAVRPGAHRRGVRARLGLREAERGGPLAGRAARKEALLHLVGAEQRDWQRAELLDHEDQRAARACTRDLLDGDLEHQRAGPGAPVLRIERQREDVVSGEQPADVVRVLALGVDGRGARPDPLLGRSRSAEGSAPSSRRSRTARSAACRAPGP